MTAGEVDVLMVVASVKTAGTQAWSNDVITKGRHRALQRRLVDMYLRMSYPFLTAITPLETQKAELCKAANAFL